MGIVGPPKIGKLLLKGRSFIGNFQHIEVYEYGSLKKFITEKYDKGDYKVTTGMRELPSN